MVGAPDSGVELCEKAFELFIMKGRVAEYGGDTGVGGSVRERGFGGGVAGLLELAEVAAEVTEEGAGGGDEKKGEGWVVGCVDYRNGGGEY